MAGISDASQRNTAGSEDPAVFLIMQQGVLRQPRQAAFLAGSLATDTAVPITA